ncbi:glucan endo-1,3-beta-glucosidase 4-like [Lycium barbarum]|uniref:glucan endo-1,3-beta-glucosidase 4-like n=1 Tax=Lycium barbarum TaxID=112863 RepID=UPI00293EDE7A|nr:glucan endo-1,3-beta-glucosidase 4-like [Lycium barbarum]
MEKQNLFFCFLVFLSFTSFCQGNIGAKLYCVANEWASDDTLLEYLDHLPYKYVKDLEPGKPCYLPFTARSHASYALNLVYRKTYKCPPHLGVKTFVNPSYGRCKYP